MTLEVTGLNTGSAPETYSITNEPVLMLVFTLLLGYFGGFGTWAVPMGRKPPNHFVTVLILSGFIFNPVNVFLPLFDTQTAERQETG